MAALGGAAIASAPHASAATGTWIGTTDFQWSNAANWSPATPGSNDGVVGTSTDVALFDQPGGGAGTEIIVDANRNIGGITWDITTAASGRTIGQGTGPALFLSAGGTIQVSSTTVSTTSPAINAPLILLGNATLLNNSTTSSAGMKLNTSITSGVAASVTLTLSGVNANTANQTSNSQIIAAITDGASAGVGGLGVFKDGTGVWDVRATGTAPNTYSGDTVINTGAIRFNGAGAMSPNSNYIVNNGGIMRLSVSGMTPKTITVNTGGLVASSSDTVVTSIGPASGPALTLNFPGATTAQSMGAPLALTGAVAGQGGINLISDNSTIKATWTKAIDLGTVNRPFNIPHSTANDSTGDPDLQINGTIAGSGGLIKTGLGTLKLNNAVNSFSGQLEIQQGSVRFNSANALNPAAPILVDGGDLDVQSNAQNVGPLTITKGTVSATTLTPGVITSPSYALQVQLGDTASIQAGLGDTGAGPSALAKDGAGSATLSGPLSYTGSTSVSAGQLSIVGNLTTSSAINITGGTLKLSSNGTNMRVIKTPSLSISGGKLNLTDNKLIVVGGAAASSWNGSAYDGTAGLVASGYHGGLQNGSGIITDQTAAVKPSVLTQLVTMSAAEANKTTFGGQAVSAGDQLVMYTYGGDANMDGTVNGDDYFRIDSHIAQSGTVFGYANGDFNYDGAINGDDYFIIDSNIAAAQAGTPFPTSSGASVGGLTAVPEPAATSLVFMLAAPLLRRRRR